MRKLLPIFLLFVISITNAQTNNFYLSDSKISWQKVYENSKTKTELMNYFTSAGIFEKKFKIVEDTIFAKLKPHKTDPNKTGVAGVPAAVNKTDFKGFVTIYFKDNEYKVVFQNIRLIGRGDFLGKKEEKPIEEYFVRRTKSEYTPGFLKKPRTIYDTTFNEIFLIK